MTKEITDDRKLISEIFLRVLNRQPNEKEIEAALDVFKGSADEAVQRAALTDIHKAVAENLPTISLFANPIWYEYSTRRFTGWVTEEDQKFRPQVHDGTRERVWHALALKPIE